jgi:hypothetical protein
LDFQNIFRGFNELASYFLIILFTKIFSENKKKPFSFPSSSTFGPWLLSAQLLKSVAAAQHSSPSCVVAPWFRSPTRFKPQTHPDLICSGPAARPAKAHRPGRAMAMAAAAFLVCVPRQAASSAPYEG